MRLPPLSPSNVSSSFLGQDFLLMLFLHIKPKSASLLVFNCMFLQWKCGYMPPLCNVCVLSRAWHFATPQTVGPQAPLSLGFSRQEYPYLTEGTIRVSQDLGSSRKRYNHAEAVTRNLSKWPSNRFTWRLRSLIERDCLELIVLRRGIPSRRGEQENSEDREGPERYFNVSRWMLLSNMVWSVWVKRAEGQQWLRSL